jgi:hypothetical protein
VVHLDFGVAFPELHQLSQQVSIFLGVNATLELLGQGRFLNLQVLLLFQLHLQLLSHLVKAEGVLHAYSVGSKPLHVPLPGGRNLRLLGIERHVGRPNGPLRGLDHDLPRHQPLLAKG